MQIQLPLDTICSMFLPWKLPLLFWRVSLWRFKGNLYRGGLFPIVQGDISLTEVCPCIIAITGGSCYFSNSERKPKKHIVQAAHNIILLASLGSCSHTAQSWSSISGVIGNRVHVADLPDFSCSPLMPRNTYSNNGGIWKGSPGLFFPLSTFVLPYLVQWIPGWCPWHIWQTWRNLRTS